MVKRRRLLLGGLGLIGMAALGAFGGVFAAEAEIASLVRRRLPFLTLDDAGVHAFSKDYVDNILAKRPTWYRIKFHFYSLFAKPVSGYGFSTDTRSRLQRTQDNLATIYLLSSDFFAQGADQTRTVQYVALYDPVRACSNPFARPPPDAAVAS